MNKSLFFIISVIAVFAFSTILYLENSVEAFSHIITFLSIITGFCITALSIIATSNFAKDLYKIEDPKNNSKTILHNLINTFTKCIITSSSTIILILISYYISDIKFQIFQLLNLNISLKTIIVGLIWYFTIISIILFFKLVFLFSKFVIQNAKRQ